MPRSSPWRLLALLLPMVFFVIATGSVLAGDWIGIAAALLLVTVGSLVAYRVLASGLRHDTEGISYNGFFKNHHFPWEVLAPAKVELIDSKLIFDVAAPVLVLHDGTEFTALVEARYLNLRTDRNEAIERQVAYVNNVIAKKRTTR